MAIEYLWCLPPSIRELIIKKKIRVNTSLFFGEGEAYLCTEKAE